MFTCSHCHVTTFASEIEREAGEWISRCQECGAKNILAVALINNVPVPTMKVIGWRD